jgi:hypothetical protein
VSDSDSRLLAAIDKIKKPDFIPEKPKIVIPAIGRSAHLYRLINTESFMPPFKPKLAVRLGRPTYLTSTRKFHFICWDMAVNCDLLALLQSTAYEEAGGADLYVTPPLILGYLLGLGSYDPTNLVAREHDKIRRSRHECNELNSISFSLNVIRLLHIRHAGGAELQHQLFANAVTEVV